MTKPKSQIKNSFQELGLECRLTVTEESVREAFRQAGKLAHPDGGGLGDKFAELQQAFEVIASPSRRFKHWLELREATVESRGTVDSGLIDLFAEISQISQHAEALIRKRNETKTALGLAVLERDTHFCRESVEKMIGLVDAAIARECVVFSDYENDENLNAIDSKAASKTARNLAFLEKWKSALRRIFSQLL